MLQGGSSVADLVFVEMSRNIEINNDYSKSLCVYRYGCNIMELKREQAGAELGQAQVSYKLEL